MNYRISQEGFDKLSRIPALLVSGCEEPQVEEAKALAEAVVGMAQPLERSDTFGPQGPDASNETSSALHIGDAAAGSYSRLAKKPGSPDMTRDLDSAEA